MENTRELYRYLKRHADFIEMYKDITLYEHTFIEKLEELLNVHLENYVICVKLVPLDEELVGSNKYGHRKIEVYFTSENETEIIPLIVSCKSKANLISHLTNLVYKFENK